METPAGGNFEPHLWNQGLHLSAFLFGNFKIISPVYFGYWKLMTEFFRPMVLK